MPSRPSVVVFDVNETLSDMAPMADRFADLGVEPGLSATWFAALLRDGFALSTVGQARPFAEIGAAVLRGLLDGRELRIGPDEAVRHVLDGFASLSLHPDVVDGVVALRRGGMRLVTLTNGPASVSDGLFERAGVRAEFEQLLSVDDVGVWKPAAAAYRYAAQRTGVEVGDLMLVAVHPWDIHGARQAGLRTAWIDRRGAPWPEHFDKPDVTLHALTDLVEHLTG